MSSGVADAVGQRRQRREPRVGEQAVAEVGRHEQAGGERPRQPEPAVLAERAQADVLVEARRARADRRRAGGQRLPRGGEVAACVCASISPGSTNAPPTSMMRRARRALAAAGALDHAAVEDDRRAVGDVACAPGRTAAPRERERRRLASRPVPVRRARRASRGPWSPPADRGSAAAPAAAADAASACRLVSPRSDACRPPAGRPLATAGVRTRFLRSVRDAGATPTLVSDA